MNKKIREYCRRFAEYDDELYTQLIPNDKADEFLTEQIPYLDCPDPELEEIYYFRWWTFRKHIKETEKGHIFTEFLPQVPWSGPYNSINCPACFHIREGRWLKDEPGWMKEYIDFWLNGIGDAHRYSAWYAHAVWEYCTWKDDPAYAIEKLPLLVAFFEERERTHRRNGGIYWSNDNLDGMEYSISGPGLRPTINSYAWADALAIARIAKLAQDTTVQRQFEEKAREIGKITEDLLWKDDFYKTVPLGEEEENQNLVRPFVKPEQDAKELVGFVPWYFNLPEDGKPADFSSLLREDGFYAPFGLTTAEQKHPRFMEEHDHECLWNGPVWPFATSQVLVAVANLLRNYHQTELRKEDYYTMLLQYARSHRLQKEDGRIVPWIDENLHPYTGRWLARDILLDWGWDQCKERGKDYNHSLFCDLVLSGLLGIDVREGKLTADPLIPDNWTYFMVENLWLKGVRYRVVYDKDGSRYGLGEGLQISPY